METNKTKKGKSKTTFFFLFHLKFVKMKKIFTILVLRQLKPSESILAARKYSRRLLSRILLPKDLTYENTFFS